MDKRTAGIIATVASAVICGCPGLGGLLFGGISVLASLVPGANIDIFGSNNPTSATGLNP